VGNKNTLPTLLLNAIEKRADIYFSDYEGINNLFKAYGSHYSIPLFAD